jgi:dUTP pyrophosphatase
LPDGVLVVTDARSALSALWTVPARPEPQPRPVRPKARFMFVDHDTQNDSINVEPTLAHHDDAGFDLTYDGHDDLVIGVGDHVDVPCGVAMQFPENTWGMLIGRSSSFRNRGILVNTAVIDPGFRGHLFAIVRNIGLEPVTIRPGERVAQVVPLPALAPRMDLEVTDQLDESVRGSKGFGSSGL